MVTFFLRKLLLLSLVMRLVRCCTTTQPLSHKPIQKR